MPSTNNNKIPDDDDEIVVVETDEGGGNARPSRPSSRRDNRSIPEDDDQGDSERVRNRISQFRRRVGDAEAREQATARDNARLRAALVSANDVALTHYEAATKTSLGRAEQDLALAYESGDGKRIVEATRQVSAATAALGELDRQKAQHEAARRQQATQPVQQEQQQQQAPRFSERTQEWVDRNAWFLTNERAQRTAIDLHGDLVDEGFEPESDDYFNEISRRVKAAYPRLEVKNPHPSRRAKPAEQEGDEGDGEDASGGVRVRDATSEREAAEPRTRDTVRTPVAAVSRTVTGSGRGRVTEVALNAAQREAAQIAGVSVQEYAASLLRRAKA